MGLAPRSEVGDGSNISNELHILEMHSHIHLTRPTLSFILPPSPTSLSKASSIQTTFSLFAKAPKPSKKTGSKVQVRLLRTIPGTGNQNQVVHVAPAYYSNVIVKKNWGVKVTDDEVKVMEQESKEREREERELVSKAIGVVEGTVLQIKRKAGEDGKLFGSVSVKDIMKMLKDGVSEEVKGILCEGKVEVVDKGGIKGVGEWECVWIKGGKKGTFNVKVERE